MWFRAKFYSGTWNTKFSGSFYSMDMHAWKMLFDRQLQILVAEKQFVHYDIYKNNFDRINSIKPMQESLQESSLNCHLWYLKKNLCLKTSCTLYYLYLYVYFRRIAEYMWSIWIKTCSTGQCFFDVYICFFRSLVGEKYISGLALLKSTEVNSLYFTVFIIDRVDF
jgi:hypothetical protein